MVPGLGQQLCVFPYLLLADSLASHRSASESGKESECSATSEEGSQ